MSETKDGWTLLNQLKKNKNYLEDLSKVELEEIINLPYNLSSHFEPVWVEAQFYYTKKYINGSKLAADGWRLLEEGDRNRDSFEKYTKDELELVLNMPCRPPVRLNSAYKQAELTYYKKCLEEVNEKNKKSMFNRLRIKLRQSKILKLNILRITK